MKMLLHLRPTCSNILATKVTLFSLYQTFLPFFYIDVTFAGVNRRDVFVPIAGRALHSPRRPAPCGRAALHSPGRPAPCGRAGLALSEAACPMWSDGLALSGARCALAGAFS